MKDILYNSAFFGVFVSIAGYGIGVMLKKKLKLAIFNPLLVAIILVVVAVLTFDMDYDTYYEGAKYLSYLLTPATVCLAIPLYRQINMLKSNKAAIAGGIISGVITSMGLVLVLSLVFGFTHEQYVTLLPKSITTAIGMGVSEELGGIVAISAAVIIITGVIGNVIAEAVFKVFAIKEPVAKGIALGTSAHAVGTSKAMEMGEIEGAMSSLSIAIAGMITVICASLFAEFI